MLGVSFNGPFGEVGEKRTMRSRGAFVAADSLPVTSVRIATITKKTHSKFTNCKVSLCDYFLPNIQCG